MSYNYKEIEKNGKINGKKKELFTQKIILLRKNGMV